MEVRNGFRNYDGLLGDGGARSSDVAAERRGCDYIHLFVLTAELFINDLILSYKGNMSHSGNLDSCLPFQMQTLCGVLACSRCTESAVSWMYHTRHV